jgi:hypothetical protein
MIGKLYIGPKDYDFTQLGTELLNQDNYASVTKSRKVKDYHTSVEDLGLKTNQCKKLFDNCDVIELLEWDTLSSCDYPSYCIILALSELGGPTSDLAKIYITHSDFIRAERTTDDPVLWTAGCSWTSAVGVEDQERWGHLVADKLNVDEVNISKPGASIWDASDQILRADIRKDDTVVWGLTSTNRVEVVHEGELKCFTISEYLKLETEKQYYTPDFFDSTTQKAKYIKQMQQVINFCSKIGAKLHIVNFLERDGITIRYLRDKNVSYIDLSEQSKIDKMIDLGTDGEHPGPKQHQKYAKEIIKLIQGERL